MQMLHHIMFSRVLAVMTFCMFLVLTPRAWVEPQSHGATQEVPVNVLEPTNDCLWCDPTPAEQPCSDSPSDTTRQIWLNPDQPLVVPADVRCVEDDEANPSS